MASLEQVRDQLGSLRELRSVVKTMKALSAVSIRQYERAVEAVGDYYQTVEQGLGVVLRELPDEALPLGDAAPPPRIGAIVFGSDHGLCGRFNEDVARHAVAELERSGADPAGLMLLAVGEQAAAMLEQETRSPVRYLHLPGSAAAITTTVQELLVRIEQQQAAEAVQDIRVFFNRPTERRGYRPAALQLLPLDRRRIHGWRTRSWPSRGLPGFTLGQRRLLAVLIQQYLFVSLYRACAESQASEHASRLSAMQSAERNLDERLEEVTGAYRRARQDAITSELLDVVAGFEATEAG